MTVGGLAALVAHVSRRPDVVEIRARKVLVIEGVGGPEEPTFGQSLRALYGVAYTMKFDRKHDGGGDVPIRPLEGDWWVVDHDGAALPDRATWRWQLRLEVPDDVTPKEVRRAVSEATTKKGGALFESPEAAKVRLDRLPRTRYGRILHVGPYATESNSFAILQAVLDERKLRREPSHTEVYLSDPRRTPADRLKTALLVKVHPGRADE